MQKSKRNSEHMKILVVGSGGREHSLCWAIAASPLCDRLWCAPGNAGIAQEAECVAIAADDIDGLVAFSTGESVDLVVVGPEQPLVMGLVDRLEEKNIKAFGPRAAAAELEGSKGFMKDICAKYAIPTAAYGRFTNIDAARAFIREHGAPIVVKADGLAAGKGVLVTEDRSAAEAWVTDCLDGRFGEAGSSVVIEEYLAGPEVSVFAVCDGTHAVMFEPARDYKRLKNGDEGPNTGGMGSYSPVDDLPSDLIDFTKAQVVEPVMRTMEADGHPFVGFLYTGLVLTADGPKVLEFNCRLGDPETQVVLPRLESDLVELLEAAIDGHVSDVELTWSPTAAVNVVLAAQGYPEQPRKGDRIKGARTSGALVFHAGTADEDGNLVTAGGRVLNVVGVGSTVAEARRGAYEAAAQITWNGKQYRNDIAGANT